MWHEIRLNMSDRPWKMYLVHLLVPLVSMTRRAHRPRLSREVIQSCICQDASRAPTLRSRFSTTRKLLWHRAWSSCWVSLKHALMWISLKLRRCKENRSKTTKRRYFLSQHNCIHLRFSKSDQNRCLGSTPSSRSITIYAMLRWTYRLT